MRRSSITVLAGLVVILISIMTLNVQVSQAEASPFDIAESVDLAELPGQPLPVISMSAMRNIQPVKMDDVVLPDAQPEPTPTAVFTGLQPDRIIIPSINVDASVVPVAFKQIEYQGKIYEQWLTPKNAVGWHDTSSPLGIPGNTVMNGHHNTEGMVFEKLVELRKGDLIQVYSGSVKFTYEVRETMIISEKYRPLEERLANSRWVQATTDERLTLITCWPPTSNTHRVVVVAYPVP